MNSREENNLILIIDDEKELAETICERLKLRKLNCMYVTSSKDAIDFIKKIKPGLVLLDLKLPDMDGIELLKRLKIIHDDIKVIFLSGHANEEDRDKCLELGALDYMLKPVDIKELIEKIKKFV